MSRSLYLTVLLITNLSSIELGVYMSETNAALRPYLVIPNGNYNGLVAEFSPDGSLLAVGKTNGHLTILDSSTGELVARLVSHRNNIASLSFSPTENRLASASSDGTVRVWCLERFSLVDVLHHRKRVTGVSYFADGRSLLTATGYGDGIVRRTHLEPKSTTTLFDERNSALAGQTRKGEIQDICIAPNQTDVAIAVAAGTILVDIATGEEHQLLPEDRLLALRRCEYSPDGRLLATASSKITVWNTQTNAELAELTQERKSICSIAFSPDSQFLLVGYDIGEKFNGCVTIWNVHKSEPVARFQTQTTSLENIAVSPDGKSLVACHGTAIEFWKWADVVE